MSKRLYNEQFSMAADALEAHLSQIKSSNDAIDRATEAVFGGGDHFPGIHSVLNEQIVDSAVITRLASQTADFRCMALVAKALEEARPDYDRITQYMLNSWLDRFFEDVCFEPYRPISVEVDTVVHRDRQVLVCNGAFGIGLPKVHRGQTFSDSSPFAKVAAGEPVTVADLFTESFGKPIPGKRQRTEVVGFSTFKSSPASNDIGLHLSVAFQVGKGWQPEGHDYFFVPAQTAVNLISERAARPGTATKPIDQELQAVRRAMPVDMDLAVPLASAVAETLSRTL